MPSVAYLRVFVLQADGLAVMDAGGSSDPYCILTIGRSGQRQKTKVIEKNLHPEWYESFVFQVDPGKDELYIKVMDKDMLVDDHMSKLTVGLAELPMGGSKLAWYSMIPAARGHPGGRIQLYLELRDSKFTREEELQSWDRVREEHLRRNAPVKSTPVRPSYADFPLDARSATRPSAAAGPAPAVRGGRVIDSGSAAGALGSGGAVTTGAVASAAAVVSVRSPAAQRAAQAMESGSDEGA